MSLAGVVRRDGDWVEVYRPTYASTTIGNRKVSSWGEPVLRTRVLFEAITDEMVQKVFGGSPHVTARGFTIGTPDIRTLDVLKVTSGPREGQVFRVENPRPQFGRQRRDHLELALERTTETVS